MKAIIPAAGYATRLYPLTQDKPKPLLPVAGKPMIEYIIEKILELGVVDHIYIVTNARFYKNFVSWQESFSCSIPIKIINDGTTSNEDRLGAIGDKVLVMKQEKIDDEILDISGDNLFNYSLKEMYALFKEFNAEVIGLFDVKTNEQAKKLGICAINDKKVITQFVEKP
jgi:glucose-1-phosphate thymidylyltransferase